MGRSLQRVIHEYVGESNSIIRIYRNHSYRKTRKDKDLKFTTIKEEIELLTRKRSDLGR